MHEPMPIEESENQEADDEDMEDFEAENQPDVKVSYRELPLELPLPSKMETLCILRKNLDQNINFLFTRGQQASFVNLKPQIENSCGRTFTVSHIQQMLEVCSWLYNHKWEVKFGKPELVVTIPSNIDALLSERETTASQTSFDKPISGFIVHQRCNVFRKKLLEKCLSEYRAYRMARKEDPDSIYIT